MESPGHIIMPGRRKGGEGGGGGGGRKREIDRESEEKEGRVVCSN